MRLPVAFYLGSPFKISHKKNEFEIIQSPIFLNEIWKIFN